MTYEQWDLYLKELEKGHMNIDYLKKMQEEDINPNINAKLNERIKTAFEGLLDKAIVNIASNLEEVFSDSYVLDMYLVNFKKSIKYIEDFVNIKQLTDSNKESLIKELHSGVEETYRILLDEAIAIDASGSMEYVVNSNRIKWRTENEL